MATELDVLSVAPQYDEAGDIVELRVRATFIHAVHGEQPIVTSLVGDDLADFLTAPSDGAKNAVLIRMLRPALAREKAKHDARGVRAAMPEFTARKVSV